MAGQQVRADGDRLQAIPSDNLGRFPSDLYIRHLLQWYRLTAGLSVHVEALELADVLTVGRDGTHGDRDKVVLLSEIAHREAAQAGLQR